MRGTIFFIVCMLAFAWIPATATSGGSDVRISEVHPRPNPEGREFVELWNSGNQTAQLANWQLTDGTNTFTFDSWALPPNGRVVIWGGGNASNLGPTWKANVWNNGGDPVMLLDADGVQVDAMEYGTADVPAPEIGNSLHFDGDWIEMAPTPGQDGAGSDGGASASIEDVPPTLQWLHLPTNLRPGEQAEMQFELHDGNGDAMQWTAWAGGEEQANGTETGAHSVVVTAPANAGTWTWQVLVASTIHDLEWSQNVTVSEGSIRIELPPGGISFHGLLPGASNVAASAPLRISHTDTSSLTPYLDLSPFAGTTESFAVDNNVQLLIRHADDRTETIRYDGPLQPLPDIPPSGWLDVTLIIETVPEPLAAGIYRTSFTVIA